MLGPEEKPIIYYDTEIRAVLDGNKSETRLPVKFGAENKCPYGRVGDRLWVREAWGTEKRYDILSPKAIPRNTPIAYRADSPESTVVTWRPPFHMTRWFSRIDLEILGIRTQHLHSMSPNDIVKEGWPGYEVADPFEWFQEIWDRHYFVSYPYDANPLAWVISHKRIIVEKDPEVETCIIAGREYMRRRGEWNWVPTHPRTARKGESE